MQTNSGTYSVDEFHTLNIGTPDHPDHAAFLEMLTHPDVQPPFFDYSDMRNYWKAAQRAADQRQGK